MLSLAGASRTEKCWPPSRGGRAVGRPPALLLPNPRVAPPPRNVTAAAPALAPRNCRRLSVLPIVSPSGRNGNDDCRRPQQRQLRLRRPVAPIARDSDSPTVTGREAAVGTTAWWTDAA